MAREVPRSFNFHWGGGQIIEEASYTSTPSRPSSCSNTRAIRFHGTASATTTSGRFQRSPMMIDGEDSFEGLRGALQDTPKLRELLRKLAE